MEDMMKEKTPKKTRRRVPLVLTIVACLLSAVVGGVLMLTYVFHFLGDEELAMLQLDQLVSNWFVGDYDQETYYQEVMAAQVDSLGDRWSYYLTPENYALVQDTRANEYVGVGITVSYGEETGLTILSVTRDGPAEEAGVTAGEVILSVDGFSVTQETSDQAIEKIKGEEGTSVTLELQRTDGTTYTVDLVRQAIQGISADWTMLEDNVGYVVISNFYSGVADQVKAGVEELQSQGATALVLDVRNNPGGYVDELTQILDFLLPEGDIFISRDAQGNEKVYTSDASCVDLPMAVLVNGESYSAAEFLAAQLQESAGAIVAGTQTCGKGFSQGLYPLADGSAVGLSTARYYTGGGVSLIGTGLTPDPQVELSEEDQALLLAGQLSYDDDLQLQAALQALAAEGE